MLRTGSAIRWLVHILGAVIYHSDYALLVAVLCLLACDYPERIPDEAEMPNEDPTMEMHRVSHCVEEF